PSATCAPCTASRGRSSSSRDAPGPDGRAGSEVRCAQVGAEARRAAELSCRRERHEADAATAHDVHVAGASAQASSDPNAAAQLARLAAQAACGAARTDPAGQIPGRVRRDQRNAAARVEEGDDRAITGEDAVAGGAARPRERLAGPVERGRAARPQAERAPEAGGREVPAGAAAAGGGHAISALPHLEERL